MVITAESAEVVFVRGAKWTLITQTKMIIQSNNHKQKKENTMQDYETRDRLRDHLRVTRGMWIARDWGGPYIEIYPRGAKSSVDVINCWDHVTGSRSLEHPHTRQHLDNALRRWITEQGATFAREYSNY